MPVASMPDKDKKLKCSRSTGATGKAIVNNQNSKKNYYKLW